MSKVAKSEVSNVIANELAKTPDTHPLYAINAMRPAILQRAADGGRRAVRKSDAEEAGVRPQEFDEWKNTVENLYIASCDYYESLGTPEEAQAEAEVMRRWKLCVQAGEEDVLTPNMYIRPTDVHNCRVWATEIDTKTVRGIGTVGVYTGLEKFRAIIETRIALRIVGNAILKDDDRDVLDTYDKATKAVDAATKIINGYTDGKNVVASIDAQILDAENVRDQVVAALKAAGVSTDDVEKLSGRQDALVKSLKDQKDKAGKKLKKWAKIKSDLQAKYDVIVEKLDSVEGVVEAASVTPAAESCKDTLDNFEKARAEAKEKAEATAKK